MKMLKYEIENLKMRYFLLIILSLFVLETFAQRKVSGVVFDTDGTILVNAQIQEDKTDNGRSADIEGFFRLTTTKDTCSFNTGYQTLNNNNNWGASVGLQHAIIYSKLLAGFSTGYYFDYYTCSVYFQGLFTSNKISYRLAYDRIDTYNFFTVGLNFFFYR